MYARVNVNRRDEIFSEARIAADLLEGPAMKAQPGFHEVDGDHFGVHVLPARQGRDEEPHLHDLADVDVDDGACAEVDLGEIGRRNDLGARRAG